MEKFGTEEEDESMGIILRENINMQTGEWYHCTKNRSNYYYYYYYYLFDPNSTSTENTNKATL